MNTKNITALLQASEQPRVALILAGTRSVVLTTSLTMLSLWGTFEQNSKDHCYFYNGRRLK